MRRKAIEWAPSTDEQELERRLGEFVATDRAELDKEAIDHAKADMDAYEEAVLSRLREGGTRWHSHTPYAQLLSDAALHHSMWLSQQHANRLTREHDERSLREKFLETIRTFTEAFEYLSDPGHRPTFPAKHARRLTDAGLRAMHEGTLFNEASRQRYALADAREHLVTYERWRTAAKHLDKDGASAAVHVINELTRSAKETESTCEANIAAINKELARRRAARERAEQAAAVTKEDLVEEIRALRADLDAVRPTS